MESDASGSGVASKRCQSQFLVQGRAVKHEPEFWGSEIKHARLHVREGFVAAVHVLSVPGLSSGVVSAVRPQGVDRDTSIL